MKYAIHYFGLRPSRAAGLGGLLSLLLWLGGTPTALAQQGKDGAGQAANKLATKTLAQNRRLGSGRALEAQRGISADVTTTLSGPVSVGAGQVAGPYTVTFANTGGSVATQVTRTVTLPAGATATAAQLPAGVTFSTAGGVVTLDFGTLATQDAGALANFSFSFTAPSIITANLLTSNITTTSDQGDNLGPDQATLGFKTTGLTLTGTVFEDVRYGGGLGRPLSTAGTVVRPGAIVELYSNNAFVASTITTVTGQYTFGVATGVGYTVRVVNSSVISSRPGATFTGSATAGYVSTQVAVQTYNGTTDRVGGEAPERTDAGPNTTGANLSTLTAGTQTAQSVALVTNTPGTTITGPDFGFNFDVITNPNDAGQGSVRQFLANAAALGNEAGLAQSGSRTTSSGAPQALPAGQETSIFMVPGPSPVPGLRTGLASGLTGGVVVVGLSSTLTLAGPNAANTALDGSTQTFNGGDTNAGTAANATTVGTDALALPAVRKPEVELSFGPGTVLDVEAPTATVRGLALHGGPASGQALLVGNSAAAGGYVFESLLVGATADGLRPATNPTNGTGAYLASQSGAGTVQLSLIAFNDGSGVGVHNRLSTSDINQFLSNFFLKNGFTTAGGDGLTFGDGGQPSGPANVVGNLFQNENSSGIQFEIGATGLTTVTNNSVVGAGLVGDPGSVVSNLEGGGIVYLSRTGNERGSQADVIAKNVITGSETAGIVIGYGQRNVTLTRNSISTNGTLGIDLINSNQNVTNGSIYGNGDGVTVNDGNDPAAAPTELANRGVDFPVLTSATVVGGSLVVSGFSRPGAEIEFFIRDAEATGFGEGQTYLATGTEGGAGDTGPGTGSYGPGAVNGLAQGTDGAASRFTFNLPYATLTAGQQAALLATGLTATATLNASTSEFSARVRLGAALTGFVYEDVNYGGGLGRSRTTLGAAAVGRPGAIVELYNTASNGLVASTITDATGQYTFSVAAGTAYTVRVVSSSVISSRPGATFTGSASAGYVSTQVAVQTYNGTADRVGGEVPGSVDAPDNFLALPLNTTLPAGFAVQSRANITAASSGATTGPDFGFNFDVIVNTNDAGQGSLRQFILNSNALTNAGLDQDAASTGGNNPAAGTETSIFMIPPGTAVAGIRAGVASGLSAAGVAVITPATILPPVTDANTALDGGTQTQNGGNTNNTTLGTGGPVGTAAVALSQVNGPEVQLQGSTAVETGLNVTGTASSTSVSGLALLGFGTAGDASGMILVNGPDFRLTNSVLGTTATSFTAPATIGRSDGMRIGSGGNNAVISNTLFGFNGGKGITTNGTAAGLLVTNCEFRANAQGSSAWDGIDLQANTATVRNNLFVDNTGVGVDSFASSGGNVTTGNTITGNGRGTLAGGPGETPGIRVYGTNNTISGNLISGNYGAGILLEGVGSASLAATTLISQNSIFNNGTVAGLNGAAASGQVGIDLNGTGQNDAAGNLPFVTLNSGNTAGANALTNYPILSTASVSGTTLTLTGFARPGAIIEVFVAQPNPGSLNSTTPGDPQASNFGQGRTYLFTLTEGATTGVVDNASGAGAYGPTTNGFAQGSDASANLFSFTVTLTSAQQALLTAAGVLLTSTATVGRTTSEFSGNVRVIINPLPVQLTAFTATAAGATALLSWTTASEVNNAYFEAERSLDGGTSFVKIGQVQGQGNKITPTNYSLPDAEAAARAQGQPLYYRLRQVDLDGTATYSAVRSVRFAATAAATPRLSVYPNPTTDNAPTTLDLSALPAGTYQAVLYDVAGRGVRTVTAQGGASQPLDVRTLASGLYLLRLRGTTATGQPLDLSQRLSKE